MTTSAGSTRIRAPMSAPRTPGLLYAVVALALAVVVGSLALTTRHAAPPTIAEFAPQAVEQITGAEQARGSAEQTRLEEPPEEVDPETGLPRTLDVVDVARARRCVGDPPRQIEDPQSPPCVPYWSGDNGGATARGVTRDEIRIVHPFWAAGFSPHLAAFFNRRFEFYGRHISLLPRTYPGGSPEAERAAARAAHDEDKAFASLPIAGPTFDHVDELARLGIIGTHWVPLFPESHLAKRRPYMWQYPMGNDRAFALVGNWYCARFAGRNAVHAGDPLMQGSRRKIGIILTEASWEGTSEEPMNSELARCGERTDLVIRGEFRKSYDNGMAAYAAFLENAILQMKTSGVTTLACLCDVLLVGPAMRAATHQAYFPEWLLTAYISNDSSLLVRAAGAQEQTEHMMMLLPVPMDRPWPDHPSVWAMHETSSAPTGRDIEYRMLLLFASGIQLAGPNLTAETFERGLHKTRFPNPPHRIKAGAAGFQDGDHTMTDDAAEVWWSNTAPSPYPDQGGVGTFCYVGNGERRRMGTFPTDDPFFTGPCYNGTH